MTDQKQRRESRQQHELHLEEKSFKVNFWIALFTGLAAFAACYASCEAHKARVNDERPFLAAEIVQPGPRALPPALTIKIRNNGKTPAKKLSVICNTQIDSSTQPISWSSSDIESVNFPFLVPTGWVGLQCSGGKQFPPKPNDLVVEMGFVQYEDIGGEQFRTPFCYSYQLALRTPDPNEALDIHECNSSRGLPEIK